MSHHIHARSTLVIWIVARDGYCETRKFIPRIDIFSYSFFNLMDKKCQFDPECIYKELLIFNIFKLCNLHPGAAVINTPRWTSLWKECKFDFTLKYCVNCFTMKNFTAVLHNVIICETYVGFLGKRNGRNLKTCKFVIPKLPLMEGVEITS